MRSRSKHRQRLVVVHQHFLQGWRAVVVGVVAVLLAVASGYWWGWYAGSAFDSRATAELRQLRAQVDAGQRVVIRLQQKRANAQAEASLDRAAAEEVRTSLLKQKKQLAGLREQISFYRSLMSPGTKQERLSIRGLDIHRADQARSFRFRLVVQQIAGKHPVLSGRLHFDISGEAGGHGKTLALKDVSDDYDSSDIVLRFKYFQNIEGVIRLPPGFVPHSVRVVAHVHGKDQVVRQFDWQVES